MDYVIAVLAVAGFAYFVYTKVKASKGRTPGSGGGGGLKGDDRPPSHDDR